MSNNFFEDSYVYAPYIPLIDMKEIVNVQPMGDIMGKIFKKYSSHRTPQEEAYRQEVLDYCEREMQDYLCHLPKEMHKEIRDYWDKMEDDLLSVLS